MKHITALLLAFFVIGFMIPTTFAETVPEWVKNTAGWWSTDVISETEFVNAIEFLVQENIIQVDASQTSEASQSVPEWVKNTAGWWSTDVISETEFVNAIEFLIKNGIIKIDDTCIYEINRVFKYTDQKIIEQLCNNEYNLDYTKEVAVKKPSDIQINEFGFRGLEITKEKPANTYRIFTIGGSTMFSQDSLDDETISYHLQKKFDQYELGVKIEVINAGIPGAWSGSETDMIKDKLVMFEPDLLLVYDGWNDHGRKEVNRPNTDEYEWRDNWIASCKFGNQNNFETIVTLQPLLGNGKKFQTDQELVINTRESMHIFSLGYQLYANQLDDIGKHCINAVDLRHAFDYVPHPVYFDEGHKNSKGNEVIAEEFFNLSIPLILEKYNISPDLIQPIPAEPIQMQTQTHSVVLDYSWRVISNQDFTGKDLKDANFEGSIIKDTDFSYANLEGVSFRFSDIDKTIFKNVNLENADISRAILTNTDFSYANLNNTKMFGSHFVDGNLKNTIMTNMDLQAFRADTFFDETILINSDISFANFSNCDLTNSDLSNLILYHTDILLCNLSGVDLSITDFRSDNAFAGSALQNTILPNELFNTDLTSKEMYIGSERVAIMGADLTSVDLRGKDFSSVQFTHLSLDTLEGVDLMFQSDITVNLSETDFSGENLSGLKLQFIKFKNANLSGADLSNSDLRFSDLSGANLEGANLEGANLEGANLKCINHIICHSS
jgi:uncharacterized protein YjbI with pentapeptide repeats